MRIKEILNEMGGNAFNGVDIRRISRNYIIPTIEFVANRLKLPGLTKDYMVNHLMGSALKQPDSGDLDIAVQKQESYVPFMRINMVDFPPSVLRDIAARTTKILGSPKYVRTEGIKGGQLNTAWPIMNNPDLGWVQIDFIYGNADWLKFSHHSPGKDISPYKGVFISTMLGVLAKIHKDFEKYDPNQIDPRTGGPMRTHRIGLKYDLEKGLHRAWEIQKRHGQGMSDVEADEFETRTPDAPRLPRIGYVDNPRDVIRLLLGDDITPNDIDTFEKLWTIIKTRFPNYQDIKERFLDALMRSSSSKEFNREQLENLDIFKD